MTFLSACRFKEISDINYEGGNLPSKAVVYAKGEYALACLGAMDEKGSYILITGGGDVTIDEKYIPHMKGSLHYWFAQNLVINHTKIEALPYGLASAYAHGLNGQEVNIRKSLEVPAKIKNEILICHGVPGSSYGYYKERAGSMNVMKDKPYCDILMNGEGKNYVPLDLLYPEMRDHNYVVSPIGLGFDCMRTWESIYLGVIPICKRYPFNSHFEDMPIAFVDEWTDINEQWLADNLCIKNKNSERCYFEYWADRILVKTNEAGI